MRSDENSLLADVLTDVAPPGFQKEVLRQTLQRVAQRRRLRTTRGVVALILLASLPLLTLDRKPLWTRHEQRGSGTTVSIISSQPLRGQMVMTRSGSISIVSSKPGGFIVFASKSSEELFGELDDARLLALLAAQGAIGFMQYEGEDAKLLWRSPDSL